MRPAPALVRNGVLVALALAVAVSSPPALTWTALLALAVSAVVAGLGAAVVVLLRRQSRLLEMVASLEEAADGRGATRRGSSTPPPGEPAPAFELPDGEGRAVSLDELRAPGLPVVLVFSDPGCGACDGLASRLAELAPELQDELVVALITRGVPVPGPFERTLFQAEHEVARAYGAGNMPAALIVDPEGRIDCPLVLGVAAIERLLLPSDVLDEVMT